MDAAHGGEPDGPGGLLLRFVNTRPIIKPDDDLTDADAAKRWAAGLGLLCGDDPVTEADVAGARELRDALVAVLKAHVGIRDDDEARTSGVVLDRAAAAHPLVPRIGVDGAVLEAAQSGMPGVLGAVLADTATAALDQRDWARFKACRNPVCYRGFHDNSRPGSALYCSHTCASQVGMRAYRARKAKE